MTLSEQIVIERDGLRLRHWRAGDLDDYFAHCNSEEVMQFLGRVRSRSAVKDEVSDFIAQQSEYGFTLWVLEEVSTQDFLGFSGLDQLDYLDMDGPGRDTNCTVKNHLELGFRIRADRWRRGYATRGGELALSVAFDRFRAKTVVARVDRQNNGSRATLEKLGFRHDFALDYWSSEYTQTCVYSLDWRDWHSRMR